MLTGDENIVDINFTVFWVIKDAKAYLFNIRAPEATVKSAAESAMREVIGETPIAQALAEGRGKIETDTQSLLQGILDSYGAGIVVTQVQLLKVDPPAPVIDAFRDVQRALADRERLRNEAEAYRNDIIPRARGDAVRIKQEARGLSPGDHCPGAGRCRSLHLGLSCLQGSAGRHHPAPLPRNHGRDPEEQQQGDHRQVRARPERRASLSAAARTQLAAGGTAGRTGSGERRRIGSAGHRLRAIFDAAVAGACRAAFARASMRR